MDYIMETSGLRKAYKGNIVVDDVNIHIPKGAIYGFVGPNGAGARRRRGSAFRRKNQQSQLRNIQKGWLYY